jgi:hypothetical protein
MKMQPLPNRAVLLLTGAVIGAGLAGGMTMAAGGTGGRMEMGPYPARGIPGACNQEIMGEATTMPCTGPYGILNVTVFNEAMTWLGFGLAKTVAKGNAQITAGQGKIITALGKMGDGQVARRNQTERNQQKTDAAVKINHMLGGSMGAVNRVCSSSGLGGAMGQGESNTKRYGSNIKRYQSWWGNHFPTSGSVTKKLQSYQDSPEKIKPDNIYAPSSMTATSQYISLVTRGKPVVHIDPSKIPGPARGKYQAKKSQWEAKANMATGAMNYIAQANHASIPATDWSNQAYEKMGEQPKSKLSRRELERLLANWRLASPKWREKIATESQAGLLREIALLKAASLKIAYDRLEDQDRSLALSASNYGQTVSGDKPNPLGSLVGKKDLGAAEPTGEDE